jgi:hypothetical protein
MMLPAAFDEVLSAQAERHIAATHNTSSGFHSPMIQHPLTVIDSIRCLDNAERFRAIHLESTVIRI